MHATEYLDDKIHVAKLLEHYEFEHIRTEGDLTRCACKLHGGDNPSGFVMRESNGLWYCHTGGCGGGNIYKLVMRMEEVGFREAVQFVADFFEIDIDGIDIINKNADTERELKAWVEALKSRRPSAHAPYDPGAEMRKVTKFRQYAPATLEHFGLMLVDEFIATKNDGQKYTIRNRLAFPIKQDGVQIGISYRRIRPADFPKWLHQPTNMQTRNILYNYDEACTADEIAVVEGIPDVWAFHEIGVRAVATFGAHLTDNQYKMLIRTGADLVLAYDGDDAGRAATEDVWKRLRLVANVKTVPFADGEDPDNLPRKELWQRYEQRHTPIYNTTMDRTRGTGAR